MAQTPPQKTNLMTPQGFKRLEDELMQLFEVERPKIVDEVHQAALQGDRSENAEYIYGKKRLREIDKRMNFLKSRLDKAKVIDPSTQKSETVQFGAKVTLQDEKGTNKTWFIVGEDEVDPSNGQISWLSPLGRACLNKRPGDYIEVSTPKGEVGFEIISIAF
jgi:transcription elongation factor GreB